MPTFWKKMNTEHWKILRVSFRSIVIWEENVSCQHLACCSLQLKRQSKVFSNKKMKFISMIRLKLQGFSLRRCHLRKLISVLWTWEDKSNWVQVMVNNLSSWYLAVFLEIIHLKIRRKFLDQTLIISGSLELFKWLLTLLF